ncbi:MAG: hypothetical protein ACREAN_01065, partial [Nitrosopumilaceae archaeon]
KNPGAQNVAGDKGGKREGNGLNVAGPEAEEAYGPSKEGNPAKTVRRKVAGMQIIPVMRPDDPREGFVDPENRGLVINFGHPLARKLASKGSIYLTEYNTCRVIVNSLVKHAAQSQEISADQALDTTAKIIQELDLWH